MKNIFLILLIFCQAYAFAQNDYTIKGTALDQDREPLIGATVVVLNPSDSTMVSFNITNNEGNFVIEQIPQGEHILQITYIGFGTFEKPVETQGNDKTLDLGTIILSSDLNKLDEVVVKGEFIPLTINKDTVEYNAEAYRVRPNANVEELLKQLPGIEIESDGSISAQGEEVKSVTVDGKKFFGDDPKMATKNIPADAVKKVQVFDQKSDQAEFSGVNDGNETKTINLELKEDKKVGYFGNVEGGYGTDGRYKAKASVNKFGAKYQVAGLVSYNNINDQGFSFSEYQTLVGGSGFGRGRMQINGPVNFDGLSNGNTTSLTGGLNLSLTPSKKIEFTSSYFLTHVDKIALNDIDKEFTLSEDNFFEKSNNRENSNSIGHNINLELEYKPDSIQRIDADFSYKKNVYDNTYLGSLSTLSLDNELINSSDQNYNTEADNDNIEAEFEYNRRLGKVGRVITLEAQYGKSLQKDSSDIEQINQTYTTNEIITESILQDQITRQDDYNYEINLNYKEPLGNDNYIDLFVVRRNYNSETVKDFYDYDLNNTTVREFNTLLSRLTNNDIIYNRTGLTYTIDKERYSLNVSGLFNSSEIEGSVIGEENISNRYNYFLPNVSFNFDDPNIRLRYRTSVSEPSINQLQSIVDNTNPTQLYVGNPSLKPEYSHDVSARYFFFDRFNLNHLFSYISYTYTKDKIQNAQTIDENKRRITSPINVKDDHRINASISYSTPIRPLKIKNNIRLGGTYTKGINIINEVANDVRSIRPYLRYSVENTNNEVVSLRLNTSLSYNENRFSINTDQNNNFFNQSYEANLSLTLPNSWYVDADYSIQVFSQEEFSDGYNFQLLNSSIAKGFMKDRILVKLSAFDLLNQNLGFSRSIENTYIQQSVTNSIQRYFMLSFVYKLTAFGPNPDGRKIRMH